MTTEVMRLINGALANFNSAEDFLLDQETWGRFMKYHWQAREPIVINKNFTVSPEQFEQWHAQLTRCGRQHAEYDPETGKIVFTPGHNPAKKTLHAAMNQWFGELEHRLRVGNGNDFRHDLADGFYLSGPHEGYYRTTDLHLRRADQEYPTLVVEMAFTESTETLFKRAKMWLDGTEGTTQLVILLDVKEGRAPSMYSRRVRQGNRIWGLTDDDIAARFPAFWPFYHHIMYWYYHMDLPLTGHFKVDMYIWGRHMPEPDKIWGCDFPNDYRIPPAEHPGNGIGRDSMFRFNGISIPFPIDDLVREGEKGRRYVSYERAANAAVEKLRSLGLPYTGYVARGDD
ncbi:predicted protein [Paecilomyces variotii No. 5]|uniref:Uncharacterized protein n=1 Tax=Byssochlamys spectabilis (strain No. 5 / NBRC 109023) TaxID=1356009 RepID=V5HUI4_BYSSN|nr:predicted protein [Paecilomyces variotii No. 5]